MGKALADWTRLQRNLLSTGKRVTLIFEVLQGQELILKGLAMFEAIETEPRWCCLGGCFFKKVGLSTEQ